MSYIMGTHAVKEVLLHAPSRLIQVLTVRGKETSEIAQLCKKHKISLSFTSQGELTRLVESDSHQSFVAKVKPREGLSVKGFLAQGKEDSFVLMLDQIFDPQNLGSLLRSAECFGVDAVIFSKNRGADLTPTAAKSSSGASELIPLLIVSNLADTAHLFQKEGYEVVAALADPGSESVHEFQYAPKTLLIVGSEGEGIQMLLRKRADRSIYIPMHGKISSLNVAQATSVLLSRRWA